MAPKQSKNVLLQGNASALPKEEESEIVILADPSVTEFLRQQRKLQKKEEKDDAKTAAKGCGASSCAGNSEGPWSPQSLVVAGGVKKFAIRVKAGGKEEARAAINGAVKLRRSRRPGSVSSEGNKTENKKGGEEKNNKNNMNELIRGGGKQEPSKIGKGVRMTNKRRSSI